MNLPLLGAVALLLSGLPAPATAQAETQVEAEPKVELSANIGIVSDYRFRGISLSDRNPALQGGLDLDTPPGFFVGAWASTIADYGNAEVEIDLYGGYRRSVATIDLDVGAYFYAYPSGEAVNYVELQGSASRSFGPVSLAVELAWVPRQANVATENLYLGGTASLAIADTGLTLHARGGRENGFYDAKRDWEAGLSYAKGPVTATVAYVDSDHGAEALSGRLGRAGVLVSLLAEF